MNSARNLCVLVLLTGCATTPPPAAQVPCAPVTVVQDTGCNWTSGVRPTKAEVTSTMPKSTLAQIETLNQTYAKNCPKQYAAWKASLPAWE